jgi:hypothetical protein
MRFFLLLLCLAAMTPATAADADPESSIRTPAADHVLVSPDTTATASAVAKPARLVSPEDYDLDHLLRCAIGCQ